MAKVHGSLWGYLGSLLLSFLWTEATEGEGVAIAELLERELVLWALPAQRPWYGRAWDLTLCLKVYPDNSAACADKAFNLKIGALIRYAPASVI